MKGKIHIFSWHALIAHKMAILRNKNTKSFWFRQLIHEITLVMGGEVLKNLTLKKIKVQTPMAQATCHQVEKPPYIVPVLRAGLSMQEAMWALLPEMPSYDIGLRRKDDKNPNVTVEEYMCKLPANISAGRMVIILDPMIASGTSACHAISLVKKTGAKKIVFMGIVCCQAGLNRIQKEHPDVEIYCAAKDPKLGSDNFIYPGLGDCGDRYKNTLG